MQPHTPSTEADQKTVIRYVQICQKKEKASPALTQAAHEAAQRLSDKDLETAKQIGRGEI